MDWVSFWNRLLFCFISFLLFAKAKHSYIVKSHFEHTHTQKPRIYWSFLFFLRFEKLWKWSKLFFSDCYIEYNALAKWFNRIDFLLLFRFDTKHRLINTGIFFFIFFSLNISSIIWLHQVFIWTIWEYDLLESFRIDCGHKKKMVFPDFFFPANEHEPELNIRLLNLEFWYYQSNPPPSNAIRWPFNFGSY